MLIKKPGMDTSMPISKTYTGVMENSNNGLSPGAGSAGTRNERLLKRQHASDCRLKWPVWWSVGETRSIWALRLLKQLFTPVKSAEKTTSPQVAIAAQQKQTLHTVLMVSAHCRAKRITWLESEVAQAHLRQAAVPDVEKGMNVSLC